MSKQLPFTLAARAAGILLHPTSLPGRHGIGELGTAARSFVDWLASAGVTWWQMLPIGPAGLGNSPYAALSAFAGNPFLIDLDELAAAGLLREDEAQPPPGLKRERVAFALVARYKHAALRKAFDRFTARGGLAGRAFAAFCTRERAWLEDHARYMALRRAQRGQPWPTWPVEWRSHDRAVRTLSGAADLGRIRTDVDYERFLQFEFDRQWTALKKYAAARGVGLIGDIPIFVAHDSSDVWAHPDLFDLNADGTAHTISGVPPDYFSRDGQLWRHPHYRWPRHQATGFAWWVARFARTLAQFDAVRIDHFLGFNRVWSVPGRAKTARRGKWVPTPGRELFATLHRKLGHMEIIAEDLGLVVPEAAALRDRCGFPGMRLLHFAFGNDAGDRYNQPHTHPVRSVVYPGTHDNETTVGWFAGLRKQHDRLRRRTPRRGDDLTPYERVLRYTGTSGREIHWDILRLALASPANTAVIPLQDVLGLDNRARMNIPATERGNWEWRFLAPRLVPRLAERLRELCAAYGRIPARK